MLCVVYIQSVGGKNNRDKVEIRLKGRELVILIQKRVYSTAGKETLLAS